ncbi:MAG: PIG-L family deacetylase [Promethearchaeota archaeon]|nr:MAG: PIG-L family deacetylase [Candidatus Lokiarchaeota archaeon]
MRPSKVMKFLFFTPHPDDIELGCPFVYLQALRQGHAVVEVVMTNGEFGTTCREFKGARLVRIRKHELARANKVFEQSTSHTVHVRYLGYIDGYLPLTPDAIDRVTHLIRAEKPNFVFTCDPLYAQDFHPDHLRTGLLVYYSLFRLRKVERPWVFYYYSTKTDCYIKCRWVDFRLVAAALAEHKSQYSPLAVKFIIMFYNKLSICRHFLERGWVSESFRAQPYRNGTPITPGHISLLQRLIYYIFSTITLWGVRQLHDLTPEQVGLDQTKTY